MEGDAAEIRSPKRFGIESTRAGDEFVKIGTNCKFNEVLAAIGVKQIEKINGIIDRRIELAKNYDKLLGRVGSIRSPTKHKKAKHVYQTYAAHVEIEGARDRIIHDLDRENIET